MKKILLILLTMFLLGCINITRPINKDCPVAYHWDDELEECIMNIDTISVFFKIDSSPKFFTLYYRN